MFKKFTRLMKKGIVGIMALVIIATGSTGMLAKSVAAATSGKTGVGSYCRVKISDK